MTAYQDNREPIQSWCDFWFGVGSILDISGQSTCHAFDEPTPEPSDALDLVGESWQAVGLALEDTISSVRREIAS